MPNIVEIKAEMRNDPRIRKEIRRLSKMFESIPPSRRVLVDRLIENAGFLAVLLEDLRAEIQANGWTEAYKHGANQHGIKRSVSADLYQVSIKNYSQIVRQLTDLIPKEEPGDALLEFLREN